MPLPALACWHTGVKIAGNHELPYHIIKKIMYRATTIGIVSIAFAMATSVPGQGHASKSDKRPVIDHHHGYG